jgi:hypothetical protein
MSGVRSTTGARAKWPAATAGNMRWADTEYPLMREQKSGREIASPHPNEWSRRMFPVARRWPNAARRRQCRMKTGRSA